MSEAWNFWYGLKGKGYRPTLSVKEWGDGFADGASRQVVFTTIGDAEVSTVFTGTNYQFGEGPPLVFMVERVRAAMTADVVAI